MTKATQDDAEQETGRPAQQNVEVYFTSEFRRNIRRLSKKYRRLQADVQPVIDQLQSGQTPGEQIPRVGYRVYKVRIQNTDIDKGKRSGYRMIYYVQTPSAVLLITIYSKSEQGDVTPDFIRRVIGEHETAQRAAEERG